MLERGFEAVWWSPGGSQRSGVPYWETCFHGRRAVSLCVYVVAGVTDPTRAARDPHDSTLVLPPDHQVVAARGLADQG